MATRAIKPKRDDTILSGWQSMPEQAPSVMRQDQPMVARILALVGVLLAAVGLLAILFDERYLGGKLGPGWGAFFLSIGLVMILYHAFVDRDLQFRRIYQAFALLLIFMGLALRVLPLGGGVGGLFLPWGFYCLALPLLLLIASLRHEETPAFARILLGVLGVLGALFLVIGLVGGQFSPDFLAGDGILFLVLGLLYFSAYIGMQDARTGVAFPAGLALGIVGAVSLLVTLLRIMLPSLTGSTEQNTFIVPSGLVLLCFSLMMCCIALGTCSDRPLIVLLRRELAAYFYSPMAYLVLVAMALVAWANFWMFVSMVLRMREFGPRGLLFEPIVFRYVIERAWIPLFSQLIVVPVLTMRLLSEEKRTGTLEMMLTAPVNEFTVVLSKFLAAWIFYLATWLPTVLFLVALRSMGGDEFDYRPLLAFFFALAAAGAGFIAMGLFFSCLTRNQIIAAVLTFMGMIVLLAFTVVGGLVQGMWSDIFSYMSFYELWTSSLEGGVLSPRHLVFHVSWAVFFLFLTYKVLEARKWS